MTATRLREVDAHSRPDHYYLDASDRVFYLREYTSGRDYSFGETNSLISNLKKSMDLVKTTQWYYKEQAIKTCAAELRASIGNPEDFTWVPVPPSKAKSDPLYDERLVQILRKAFPAADIREFVVQPFSATASHTTGQSKPTPDELASGYELDDDLGDPKDTIVIFDDILTTGSHFKAVQQVFEDAFPDCETLGLFIARRVFPKDDD